MNLLANTYARTLLHYACFFCALTFSTSLAVMVFRTFMSLLLSFPTIGVTAFLINIDVFLSMLLFGAAFMIYKGGPFAMAAGLPVWVLTGLALRHIGFRRPVAAAAASIPTGWVAIAAMMFVLANPKLNLADVMNFSYAVRSPFTGEAWLSPIMAICTAVIGPILALRMFPDHG